MVSRIQLWICYASIAHDLAGSVVHPAGHAGVVGLKPTVGLTSRDGVIPGSRNRDSVGAFAKNVHDAALLLDAMYGPDDNDPWSLAQIGKTADGGYAQYVVDFTALRGAVFGIPYPIWWSTIAGIRAPGNEAKMLARLDQLKAAGATIINMTEPLPYAYDIQNAYGWGDAANTSYWLQSQRYLNVDLYNDYTGYLQKLTWPNGTTGGLPLENLGDLVVWNNQNNATTGALGGAFPWKSGQDALIAAVATAGVRDDRYWTAWCMSCSNYRHSLNDSALTLLQTGAWLGVKRASTEDTAIRWPTAARSRSTLSSSRTWAMARLPQALQVSSTPPSILPSRYLSVCYLLPLLQETY
jgi:amidase